jgi:nucleotide-binding universal stress UspA family protein
MKKVLVPTDFSANSKSGVRFAIRWASQQKLELVFVHVLNIARSSKWSEEDFETYAATEEQACGDKFERFIRFTYRQMKIRSGKSSLLILRGISPDLAILDHCRKNPGFDYICISTRGAGKQKKIYGTNTGNLITKSPVPVIAVPLVYRVTGIKSVLYATDLKNYEEEFARVVEFAKPLKARIEAVHFTWPEELNIDQQNIVAAFKKRFDYDLKLHLETNQSAHSITESLQEQVRIRKPSLVIMFTNQKRSFFQKLFISSKAEQFSFDMKVPLLVFNKK